MFKMLALSLILLGCSKSPTSVEEPKVGQYNTKDTADYLWENYSTGRFFTFTLDDACLRDGGKVFRNERIDSAFNEATRWRAWTEIGESPNVKFYTQTIKKGLTSWEPSCVHPWGDSIKYGSGNVKSVVVWE